MSFNSRAPLADAALPARAPVRSPGEPMPIQRRSRHAGFTLVETLLAATLGALLLAAAASTAGQFSQAMAKLEADSSDSYENTLARVNRDIRYAWSVDVPSRGRLLVTGSDGLVTAYDVVGNSLLVTRPDGATGSLVTGLDSLSFEADTLQRLRSSRSTTVATTMASRQLIPLAPLSGTAMASSIAYAISFMGGSDAGARMVPGVSDRYTLWQPTSIELPVARVGSGNLTFSLYRAFGPGRAEPRPGSAAIATWTQSLAGIPLAVAVAVPPLVPRTVYAVPLVSVPINIPVLPTNLEPGVAYTLVITVSAGATAVFATCAAPTHTDQMVRTAAGVWQGVAALVPYTLRANGGCTTTLASEVTTQVRTTIETEAGQTYVGSACVYGQVLAEDPWLGVVPGELPADS